MTNLPKSILLRCAFAFLVGACGGAPNTPSVATAYESAHASADSLEDRGDFAAAAQSLEPRLADQCGGELCVRMRSDLASRIAENYLAAGNATRAREFGQQAEQISRPLHDEWRVRALIVSGRTFEANADPVRASETYEQAQILAVSLLEHPQ